MKKFLTIMGLALVFAQPAAAASLMAFTDRASFEAATGTLSSEDFNSVVGEPSFNGVDLAVGDLTLFSDGVMGRNFIDQPPLQFSSFNVDGTTIANILVDTTSSFTISFSSAVTAFGASFAALNDGIQRTVIDLLGETIVPPVQSSNTVQFFGLTSDTAFSSLTFRGLVDGDGFGMDNVVWGNAATPVPLPAGFVLLLSGLGLLMLRRRG